MNGTNAYAVLPSPRASGTEAMIISASRFSRSGDGVQNLRGIATVLSLASFLKGPCNGQLGAFIHTTLLQAIPYGQRI